MQHLPSSPSLWCAPAEHPPCRCCCQILGVALLSESPLSVTEDNVAGQEWSVPWGSSCAGLLPCAIGVCCSEEWIYLFIYLFDLVLRIWLKVAAVADLKSLCRDLWKWDSNPDLQSCSQRCISLPEGWGITRSAGNPPWTLTSAWGLMLQGCPHPFP